MFALILIALLVASFAFGVFIPVWVWVVFGFLAVAEQS